MTEARRDQILTAFEACVVRKGLAQTTLADVAEEAGQPRPLVRHFIGNRDAMVTCLIERLLERGEAQMDRALSVSRQVSPDAMVELLFDEIFADSTSNMIIMELWHLSLRDEALRSRLGALYQKVVFEIGALIAKDAAAEQQDQAFDGAYSAVSLALGSAFFRHLGLQARSPGRVRANAAALVNSAPTFLVEKAPS
jgi:AcrR family transcriptional regulator